MNRKLTTNSRLVNELFANYISTFTAFCELMNNSIQAKAKNIWIERDYNTYMDSNKSHNFTSTDIAEDVFLLVKDSEIYNELMKY